ncbi:copper transporter 6-like [Lycium barbarum]|uniref:copper transporter 6-like n=1 Tax=Lycium barbarum TaxID=112863 RepID=UPI00293E19A1|nr:copper transporter 6-like [Lycium barbarum]
MDHDHNMPGMGGMSPPPPRQNHMNNNEHMMGMGLTHMTFFWSKNAEILFSGWPGTRTGMYVLALICVFVLSLLVEWLSNCNYFKGNKANGLVQTFVHGVKIGLAYLLMLAVMSFNVGVFIVVVAGHTLGYFLFGSRTNSENNACQA